MHPLQRTQHHLKPEMSTLPAVLKDTKRSALILVQVAGAADILALWAGIGSYSHRALRPLVMPDWAEMAAAGL